MIEFGTRWSFRRLQEPAFVAIVLRMTGDVTELRIHRKMIDSLYVEAMVLADEARGYFDQGALVEREALDPLGRVTFSCESLKVTKIGRAHV